MFTQPAPQAQPYKPQSTHGLYVGERPNPNGATKRFGKGRADTQSDTAARKEGGLRRRAINRGNMVHVLAPPGRPSSTDE